METSETVANLVIGGGPAGSMLAMRLADAGHAVTLLEKEPGAHHKVCGEFLSRETVEYLQQAGLPPRELGAEPIHSLRFSSGRGVVQTRLPFLAYSLSRYTLDAAMLERAGEKGCAVMRGAYVEKAEQYGNNWMVKLRDGRSMQAKNVFLANGKHDLHGWDRTGGKQCELVGFKMHWRLDSTQTKALRGFMELFLFRGGYGGLSLIEAEAANLCMVVQRSKLRERGGWSALLAAIFCENPLLTRRMQGADALWDRPLAISPIPYGYLVDRPNGLWCVGDQAAVVPSFTGDGMAIALHSAALAADLFMAGTSSDEYHRRLTAKLSRGMALATGISRAMVTKLGRGLAPFGLWLFPRAMQWIAQSTRIPEDALVREMERPRVEGIHRSEHIA